MNNVILNAISDVINSIADNPELQIRVDVLTGCIDIYDINKGLYILKWKNDCKTGDSVLYFNHDEFEYEAIKYKECDQIFFRQYNTKSKQRFIIDQGNLLFHLFNDIKWKYIPES